MDYDSDCEEYYQFMLDMLPEGNEWLWIAHSRSSIPPTQVVREVMCRLNASGPIASLRDCEVRAYCSRYLHYKGDGPELSDEDLEYTAECEGILWEKKHNQYWWYVVSMKDYLETRDPGFAGFNNHHDGVDAA